MAGVYIFGLTIATGRVELRQVTHRKDPMAYVDSLIRTALEEDIGRGDLTSLACLEPNPLRAHIVAKSVGVLSGLMPALKVFDIVDSANRITPLKQEGSAFAAGDIILNIDGFNQTVLASERVALNFLAHLSGVATMTSRFVAKLNGSRCRVLDTRKTTPGWRYLEKLAVQHGGGVNHRFGLFDMILVKDNHIASAGSVTEAVRRAREFMKTSDFRLQFDIDLHDIFIEVEVTNENELREACDSQVDRIMLDNQSLASLARLVESARKLNPSIQLEASGNITLDTVAEVAATGVDFVSIGALTHSAPASDFSLKVVPG
ncbi:MAG: carboxylating nicotinate-nucleotide diphosphorylase [Candidatus Zixiibacteriota bacterium]